MIVPRDLFCFLRSQTGGRMRPGLVVLASLVPFAAVAGCTVGPDYQPPSASDLGVPEQLPSGSAAAPDAVRLDHWWTGFGDAQLAHLVEMALGANLDIRSAEDRLRQSAAQLRGARAGAAPTISASVGPVRTSGNDPNAFGGFNPGLAPTNNLNVGPGADQTLLTASLKASWEPDIFGGTRRSVEAAHATLGARDAALRSARLTVAAETARGYVDLRLAQARLAIVAESLTSRRQTLQIASWRREAGLGSAADVERARQAVAEVEATTPDLSVDVRTAMNRITVLTGAAPGRLDAVLGDPGPVPAATDMAPDLTPLAIVRRRPDVEQAERTLAAEVARIGVQQARLYPGLSLSGSFGSSARSFSGLADGLFGSLSALVNQTLFDGGSRRADLEAQRAVAAAALNSYRAAVLEALEDVDNAFARRAAATRRRTARSAAEAAALASARLLRDQYRAGLVDFTTLLDAERTLLSSSDARVTAEANESQAAIALIQALGGDEQGQAPAVRGGGR